MFPWFHKLFTRFFKKLTQAESGCTLDVLLMCFNSACWVKIRESAQFYRVKLAPPAGFEPTTVWSEVQKCFIYPVYMVDSRLCSTTYRYIFTYCVYIFHAVAPHLHHICTSMKRRTTTCSSVHRGRLKWLGVFEFGYIHKTNRKSKLKPEKNHISTTSKRSTTSKA